MISNSRCLQESRHCIEDVDRLNFQLRRCRAPSSALGHRLPEAHFDFAFQREIESIAPAPTLSLRLNRWRVHFPGKMAVLSNRFDKLC